VVSQPCGRGHQIFHCTRYSWQLNRNEDCINCHCCHVYFSAYNFTQSMYQRWWDITIYIWTTNVTYNPQKLYNTVCHRDVCINKVLNNTIIYINRLQIHLTNMQFYQMCSIQTLSLSFIQILYTFCLLTQQVQSGAAKFLYLKLVKCHFSHSCGLSKLLLWTCHKLHMQLKRPFLMVAFQL